MKKLLLVIPAAILLIFFLQGCLKDSCRNTYTLYIPVYKNLSAVRASMKAEAPRLLQNTGKIYTWGHFIFINEIRQGIHVIDNNNPSKPVNLSFISIPGNVDMAVKGNYLYADCYSDIVVFDISHPASIVATKFLNNVIKEYNYYWANQTNPDSVSILVDYIKKDTVVDCDTYTAWMNCPTCSFIRSGPAMLASAPTKSGTGGSMARFSVVNNYLYAVSSSRLYSFNLVDASSPQITNAKSIAGGIETIYPFENKLFIGSTTGMFIYDISNASDPVMQGAFSHAKSCDPVIADGQYAYVTLRSGNACSGIENEMDVLDINNLNNPWLVKKYSLTNPYGLSKDGNTLFVCDGKNGVKVYDASNPNNLQLIRSFSGMESYDVIALDGKAILIASDGLYQYDYSNPSNIVLLSKIAVSKSSL